MKTRLTPRSSFRLLPLCLGVALLGTAAAAQAAVGARVLLQEWSPLTPQKQGVRVLANDPNAVSTALQRAWSQARPVICAQLQGAMGRSGAAGGQTLRDIDCQLDTMPAFSVATAGANALTATLSIGGYVAARSTTPTALGSYADPRFSLAIKANMVITLAVQNNASDTLRVDRALFTLSNATLDSQNFSGDLLKFVANDLIPFFHGPNYKRLAETAINSVSIDVASRFNAAFAPVNVMLRAPSGLVRMGVWGKPDGITVAFGPREVAPPSGGTVTGAVRWSPSQIGAPGNCDGFTIDAVVQTGPAPLRDPGGYYEASDAPTRKVGSFQLVSGVAGECRYRVSGLAAGWPNVFSAHSIVGNVKRADNSVHSIRYTLAGDGWDGHNVTPQPSAERNYVVKTTLDAVMVVAPSATLKHEQLKRFDPHVNPVLETGAQQRVILAAQGATLGTAAVGQGRALATTLAATAIGSNRGAAVALNPQPLPPAGLATTSAFAGRGH